MGAKALSQLLRGKKVVITAGPTREYWDPVRFLSNGSSGQMGMALANHAANLGARVILILGPTSLLKSQNSPRVRVVPVTSALEMEKEVRRHLPKTTVFIGAAAVSDFRPQAMASQKLKGKPKTLHLKLVRNPDIIAGVAQVGQKRPHCVVGFALETQNVMKNAQAKLTRKGLDWIVANRETNMGSAKGRVTLFSRRGQQISFGPLVKDQLAKQIWNTLLKGIDDDH